MTRSPDTGPLLEWDPALKDISASILLIAGGFSIKEVSQWCGHASTAVTLGVYAHVEALSEDDAPDRLEALMSPGSSVKGVKGTEAVTEHPRNLGLNASE